MNTKCSTASQYHFYPAGNVNFFLGSETKWRPRCLHTEEILTWNEMKTFMHAPTFWSLIWSSCELGILVPKGKLPLKEPNLYKRFKNQI